MLKYSVAIAALLVSAPMAFAQGAPTWTKVVAGRKCRIRVRQEPPAAHRMSDRAILNGQAHHRVRVKAHQARIIRQAMKKEAARLPNMRPAI